jgi:EF hand
MIINRVRFLLALLTITASSSSALAQRTVTFEGFDANADGRLSILEFGQLPGLYGTLDRFRDLDKGRDGFLSREEWQAGSPDESGIPLGSDAIARAATAAGARPGTPPSLSRHGRNVPLLPVNTEKPKGGVPTLSAGEGRELLTGRGGADSPKRPVPPPAIPPKPEPIPAELRPPAH